ncbi:MAG: DNA recombination protein RmuC [Candidatus Zixiibacteriota bacterium]
MNWILLFVGLAAGAVIAWAVMRAQSRAALEAVRAEVTAANRDALGIVGKEIEDKNTEIGKLRSLYDGERVARAGLEATLRETERRLEEQRQFVENSKKQLEDTFKALSKDALDSNTRSFLERADAAVKPLDEALHRYEEQTRLLEASRQQAYGSLEEQLKTVTKVTQQVQVEADNLVKALRKPQVRGRWGELTLRNALEQAGLSKYCDFQEQVSVGDGNTIQRPDVVVRMPGGREVVIDSKVPLEAFLDAVEASSDETRAEGFRRHGKQVREHLRKLSGKEYWKQFARTPDYVVMFIPGESFFVAAVEVEPGLIDEAIRNRVALTSPATVVMALRTLAMEWREAQFAENAEQIRRLGHEFHDRIATFVSHFAGVGRSLDQAMASYDKAAGSLESRVLVTARKLKELGATAQTDIPEVPAIGRLSRGVQADLLTADSDDGI